MKSLTYCKKYGIEKIYQPKMMESFFLKIG